MKQIKAHNVGFMTEKYNIINESISDIARKLKQNPNEFLGNK